MFKIYFEDCEEKVRCFFAEVKTDIEACQLSLALHQSSNNASHVVRVFDDHEREIIVLGKIF